MAISQAKYEGTGHGLFLIGSPRAANFRGSKAVTVAPCTDIHFSQLNSPHQEGIA
jgi:hypothetical protein